RSVSIILASNILTLPFRFCVTVVGPVSVQTQSFSPELSCLGPELRQVPQLRYNPIEHLWSELERRMTKNIRKLETVLQDQITKNVLINSIKNMPRACTRIVSKGWPTKY